MTSFSMLRAVLCAGTFLISGSVQSFAQNGNLDLSFSTDGKLTTDFDNDHGYRVAVQPDGKIVLAGLAVTAAGSEDFAVARILSGLVLGTLDFSQPATTISVYPNPVAETAVLSYTLADNETVGIELLNMEGKVLGTLLSPQKQQAGAYEVSLDLASFPAGQYLLRVYAEQGQTTVRIIK